MNSSPEYNDHPFRPLRKDDELGYPIEQSDPLELKLIMGEIPKDLAGKYIRTGPNPYFKPRGEYHWFDGDGMLHAVELKNGTAFYQNRFVETRKLKREKFFGSSLFGGFKSGPSIHNIFSYFLEALPIFPDVSNTDLIFHDSKLYSLCAPLGQIYEIDPQNLATLSIQNFSKNIKKLVAAHSKVDSDGNFVYYGFNTPLKGKQKVWCGQISPSGESMGHTTVDFAVAKNMHDFAITKNYIIIFDQPLEITAKGLAFNPQQKSRFGFVKRTGEAAFKDIQWLEGPADYTLHTANAFENSDGSLEMQGMDVHDFGRGANGQLLITPVLTKWSFNLKSESIKKVAILPEKFGDFPTINENYLCAPNRYTYLPGLAENPKNYSIRSLLKVDAKGEFVECVFPEGLSGNEFSFIPKKNETKEDDGYLIGFLANIKTDTAELCIIAAETMETICRLSVPRRVPAGFHGVWLDSAAI